MSFFFFAKLNITSYDCLNRYFQNSIMASDPKVLLFFLIYLKIINSMQIPYEGTHLKLRIYTCILIFYI